MCTSNCVGFMSLPPILVCGCVVTSLFWPLRVVSTKLLKVLYEYRTVRSSGEQHRQTLAALISVAAIKDKGGGGGGGGHSQRPKAAVTWGQRPEAAVA